jgi:hypothetical protein
VQIVRRVCPNTVRILHYIVRKLNAVPESQNWLAVRLSYGMNGILLPSAHLADLAAYMKCAAAPSPRCLALSCQPTDSRATI